MEFAQALRSNFLSIAQIFVLGGAGFYVLKRNILGQCCLRTISNLVIEVSLPCFMFTNILANFDRVRGEGWYLFPLLAILIFAVGAAVAALYTRADRGIGEKKEFI